MGFNNINVNEPEYYQEVNCSSLNFSLGVITGEYLRTIIEINTGWIYDAKRTDIENVIHSIDKDRVNLSVLLDFFLGWGILLYLHDDFFICTGIGIHGNMIVISVEVYTEIIGVNLGIGTSFCFDYKISEKSYIKLGIIVTYDPLNFIPSSSEDFERAINILPSLGWVYKFMPPEYNNFG